MTDEERFWSKVDIKGENECWEYKGYITQSGYGQFRLKGKGVRAHRFAYELTKGTIPEGACICHTCDNRPCCNPKHLWKGNPKENTEDRINKGRTLCGENNGRSKFTEDDIISMKRLYQSGFTVGYIASRFGVGHGHISNILSGRQWKGVK
jgi:hypothetical protein